jgi:hypothetical protein
MPGLENSDIESIAGRINEENRGEDERAAARRIAAQAEAARIAAALRSGDPAIRRVWGFGSVFEASRRFRMDSDIDLAIEGGDLYRAVSVVGNSSFKVDVIDITDSSDSFAQLVREQGTIL